MHILIILLLLFIGYLIYTFARIAFKVHRVVKNVRSAAGFPGSGTRRQPRRRREQPRRRSARKIPKEYAVDAVWEKMELRGDEDFLEVYDSKFSFRKEEQVSEADYEIIP